LKPSVLCSSVVMSARVAFTPKGGCPLKRWVDTTSGPPAERVAFTPKGGCPLKPKRG